MDTNTAIQIISTLGFPVVCCWFLWKYITDTMKELTALISKNSESIARLCDKIDLIISGKNEE